MNITGQKSAFIETSKLNIVEVPLNISTRFQCTGSDENSRYSKMISFGVKGKKKTVGKLVYFI